MGAETLSARDDAMRELARLGRFAEPALCRVIKATSDAEIRARAKKLLNELVLQK